MAQAGPIVPQATGFWELREEEEQGAWEGNYVLAVAISIAQPATGHSKHSKLASLVQGLQVCHLRPVDCCLGKEWKVLASGRLPVCWRASFISQPSPRTHDKAWGWSRKSGARGEGPPKAVVTARRRRTGHILALVASSSCHIRP